MRTLDFVLASTQADNIFNISQERFKEQKKQKKIAKTAWLRNWLLYHLVSFTSYDREFIMASQHSFPLTLCCATAKSVPVGLRNTESVTLVFPKLPVLVVSLGVNSARWHAWQPLLRNLNQRGFIRPKKLLANRDRRSVAMHKFWSVMIESCRTIKVCKQPSLNRDHRHHRER